MNLTERKPSPMPLKRLSIDDDIVDDDIGDTSMVPMDLSSKNKKRRLLDTPTTTTTAFESSTYSPTHSIALSVSPISTTSSSCASSSSSSAAATTAAAASIATVTQAQKLSSTAASCIYSSIINNIISNSRSSLLQQHSAKAALNCFNKFNANIMRNYLNNKNDMCVVIINAKVAQKSYGNEKRFFCPPPCVFLYGTKWQQSHQQLPHTYKASELLDKKSNNDTNKHTDYIQQKTQSNICTFIGIGNSTHEMQPLIFDSTNFAAAKTMFISDSDKRKHFKLLLRAYYKNGQEIGSFSSNNIKVISKPSKKKQSVKNSDLCIASGTKVALFNRLRSQTVSTRYLYCENDTFYASSQRWGSFYIYLIEDNGCESEEFIVKEGYLHYGATVKLVCTITGMALPRLVIRKVDKCQVILNACDAVSQLHKCAFYLKDSEQMYLCLSQDRIIQFKATDCPKDQNREFLNDGACWTIISTDEAKYTWCETMGTPIQPITPMPCITNMKYLNENDKNYVELKGDCMNFNLQIWFNDVESEIIIRCTNYMKCKLPDVNAYNHKKSLLKSTNQHLKVNMYLVRDDGVVYNSGYSVTYSNTSITITSDSQDDSISILERQS